MCITKKLDTNKADKINLSKMLGLIFSDAAGSAAEGVRIRIRVWVEGI